LAQVLIENLAFKPHCSNGSDDASNHFAENELNKNGGPSRASYCDAKA
jgi:hypothetical protein